MVDHEQRHAFDLRRRTEPQHRLAGAVAAQPIDVPALVADFALRIEHLEQAFVSLRFRIGPLLGLLDNLTGILSSDGSVLKDR